MTAEEKREYSKKWRTENKEIRKARAAKYYAENKDKINQKAANYYAENKDKVKAKVNEYREANQDKIREYRNSIDKEKKREQNKKWADNNKFKKAESDKLYRDKNILKIKDKKRERYIITRDHHLEKCKERFANRLTDESIYGSLKSSSRKYHSKIRDNLTDVYVARQIKSIAKDIPIECIQSNKELIQLYRINLKLKRTIKLKQNETSEQ